MEWGDEWGGWWGGPEAYEDDHAGVAAGRLPDITRDTRPKLVALVEAEAERWQIFENFVRSVQPYYLLDYERVSGVWLDHIGAFLGVPRLTRDDAYYRTVLGAYARVIWPRGRYLPGMLEGLGIIAGDPAAVHYSPSYPMGFVVTVDGLTLGSVQAYDVINIVRTVLPICYNAQTVLNPATNPFKWTDATATISVTTEGFADASGTLTAGGKFASVTAI